MYTLTGCVKTSRINSTALPEEGQSYEVILKEGCDILHPVFKIQVPSFNYNMVKFNNRYYWINRMTWLRENLLEISCTVDVLSSWRSQIKSSSAFVMYSSSVYNSLIADARLLTEAKTSREVWNGNQIPAFNAAGSYTVGIIGKPNSPSPTGMTCVYSMTERQASDLAVAFNEGSVMEQITQQFGSAFSALIFCRWLPVAVDANGVDNTISIAGYNTGDTAKLIKNRYILQLFQVEIPRGPDDFRSVEPYSNGYLYLPYIGVVPLSLSALSELHTIEIRLCIDRYTGDLVYKIGGDYYPMAVYSGNCAIEVPINSYQRDWKGVVSNGVSALVNIASTGISAGIGALMGGGEASANTAPSMAGDAVGGLAGAAMSYFTFNTGSVGGFSGGCGLGLGLAPIVTVVRHDTSDEPSDMGSLYGRPCGQVLSLSGLSGYVQTQGFEVTGTMSAAEKSMINNMLNGGVYIE